MFPINFSTALRAHCQHSTSTDRKHSKRKKVLPTVFLCNHSSIPAICTNEASKIKQQLKARAHTWAHRARPSPQPKIYILPDEAQRIELTAPATFGRGRYSAAVAAFKRIGRIHCQLEATVLPRKFFLSVPSAFGTWRVGELFGF